MPNNNEALVTEAAEQLLADEIDRYIDASPNIPNAIELSSIAVSSFAFLADELSWYHQNLALSTEELEELDGVLPIIVANSFGRFLAARH